MTTLNGLAQVGDLSLSDFSLPEFSMPEFSMPTFSDFSMPSFGSSTPSASGSNTGTSDFSWLTDLVKTGVNAYGQIATIEAKSDLARQQAEYQQAMQQRNSLMYPFGTNTGLNSSYFGTGGLSPFPTGVGMSSGLSATTIIGGLGVLIAAFALFKKD